MKSLAKRTKKHQPTAKSRYETIAILSLEVIGLKEYEILYDTGEARKLVAQINRWAKEGWQAKSIGALGAPTGIRAVYVLMEREVS
jgi:hypothetical protein